MVRKLSCSVKTAIFPSLCLTSGISVNVQDLAPSCAGLLFGKDPCGVAVVRGVREGTRSPAPSPEQE